MNTNVFTKYFLYIEDKEISFDDNNFVIISLSAIEKSIFYEPKRLFMDISLNKSSLSSIIDNFSSDDIDKNIFSLCDKKVKLCLKISNKSDFTNNKIYTLFFGYFEKINVLHKGEKIILKTEILDLADEINRTIIRYYSSAEQRQRNPNDNSLDFNKEIVFRINMWGVNKIHK